MFINLLLSVKVTLKNYRGIAHVSHVKSVDFINTMMSLWKIINYAFFKAKTIFSENRLYRWRRESLLGIFEKKYMHRGICLSNFGDRTLRPHFYFYFLKEKLRKKKKKPSFNIRVEFANSGLQGALKIIIIQIASVSIKICE